MTTDSIISKVWSFCNTLRDDGVGYGDYLEQLTYLIFLKMADEYGRPPYSREVGVPARFGWRTSASSSTVTTRPTAISARKRGTPRRTPKGAGASSPMPN
jgi:hypothetical protein